MKKYLLIFGVILTFTSLVNGQQIHRNSQFLFNSYLVNPAVAGTKLYSPVFITYRNQWTGFDKAPVTYTLSGHHALPNRIGIGAIIYKDDTGGAISETGAELTGSYRIDLNNQDAVSFGLSGIISQFKFDNTVLDVYEPNDVALDGNVESRMNFDANFGMMVYGSNYFFGFSIPQLIQTKLKLVSNGSPDLNKNARHYQFMGSYKYYVTDEIDIQPSALAKFTASSPVQFDINMKVTYLDFLWGGVSYRHKDAIVIGVGTEFKQFAFGYSYDITFTDARSFSPHTHELVLGYYFVGQNSEFVQKSSLGKRRLSRKRIVN